MLDLKKSLEHLILDSTGLLIGFTGIHIVNNAINDGEFIQGVLGTGLIIGGYKLLKYVIRRDFKRTKKYYSSRDNL